MRGAGASAVVGIGRLVIIDETSVRIGIVVLHPIAGLLTNFPSRHSWYRYPKDLPVSATKGIRALGSETNTCVLSDRIPERVWRGRDLAYVGFVGRTRSLD